MENKLGTGHYSKSVLKPQSGAKINTCKRRGGGIITARKSSHGHLTAVLKADLKNSELIL